MSEEKWHVSKGIPLALIVTIIVQSCLVVWWAASLNAEVQRTREDLAEYMDESDSENLRQWSRINQNESGIERALASMATNEAILERVEDNVSSLKQDVSDFNELLREYLSRTHD